MAGDWAEAAVLRALAIEGTPGPCGTVAWLVGQLRAEAGAAGAHPMVCR